MTTPNFSKGGELEEALLDCVNAGKIELTEKWVTKNESLKAWASALFPNELENHKVLEPRLGKRSRHVIQICSVHGTEYENLIDTERVAIYVGGPGSMVAAALDSVTTHKRGGVGKVMYATHSFEHSNARSSAYYFHLRHSNALDADPTVRGPAILREFARRLVIPTRQMVAEAREQLDYMKIDVSLDGLLASPAHCANTMGIMLYGFVHTTRNVILEETGFLHLTDWVRNRAYSWYSIPVFRFLELEANDLGVRATQGDTPSLLVGQESDRTLPRALHVVFDEASARRTEEENAQLLNANGIVSRKLTRDELSAAMGGDARAIHAAYVYPQDGRVSADMNVVLRDVVRATGNTWREGLEAEKVFVDGQKVRGVVFRNATTDERWYQPCTSLVLSLGYTAQYEMQGSPPTQTTMLGQLRSLVSRLQWKLGRRNPIGAITVASGGSGYFLVRGKIPIIGTQNSHWTEVAYSPQADVTLAKLTGGGNIASEYIPVTYPLNNLEHIRRMFGDRFIDVLSLDSCPRSINPQNDVQFYRLASGLIVVAGLGGTGMTKSGANGALSLLLSHPELRSSELIPGSPDLFSKVDLTKFVCDCTCNVQRALGHRRDFSTFEVCCSLGAGLVAWLLWKKRSVRSNRSSERGRHRSSSLARMNRTFSPPLSLDYNLVSSVSWRRFQKRHLTDCHAVASKKAAFTLLRTARTFCRL